MTTWSFEYEEFNSQSELPHTLSELLQHARKATSNAYAPYSHFKVGAAVLLKNGTIVMGVNVENASYPVGICAERSALSNVVSNYPKEIIEAIAISYVPENGKSTVPASPCGMCRQFISECEDRNTQPIKIILSGMEGKVLMIHSAKHLLPFSFSGSDLK